MSNYQSDLLRLLDTRGYIHDVTNAAGLDALAQKEIVPGYIGFDPTAPSLHVGSLVQIMMLRRMQQAGHKPIVLMGGGTGKIGDPSFKDEARKLLTDDLITSNVASIKRVFEKFLTFGDGPTDAVMVDNADWLDALEYIPFLRDIGQHFSVNRMLSFDSVKLRLDREQSLSFLEFNYMILQAYDFLELSRRSACRLQMGGSDQWGNIVNGIELARRVDGTQVYGLTSPLITTADGGKMGKTMNGAVWLNADALPPYDYWQFWRNTQDADVGRFMRLFTDLPLDEIARLEALQGAEINEAKKILADAATAMAHGAEAAAASAETARKTFEEGASDANLPTVSIGAEGLTVVQANVALGFASSNKEARRKLLENAIRVNGNVVNDPALTLKPGDKVSFGAKKHGIVIA
ncbi:MULTISPECIES: tyrosine--tRNA ligase [unclassified Sphingobium]|uniref:tyrosine--tRNA ligase n=1 Tax=unclassified Sphingobium TaxID=2611147 RepID=UPI000D178B74|nr:MULTISPECIES: tyrosine--tRNA ligase [unclassified Sphingobium]MBG6116923.1 tyrosyl-tRNA synthetase [Sphingobium sp. JAI105]PSO12147.1 tyrosine--tRNA ligase [Sphingobium sp. AEW4]TWD02922.1 tyrosyl-tRNA synthetase [Sphingobium sp. AEW010]TWD20880.1 tyrosyl-tRNA synthetase [Sphingobium sp. AEW013]TWD23655.1 tyrosyl-tRNA synthetase [Sphingobium sp. AEW001]